MSRQAYTVSGWIDRNPITSTTILGIAGLASLWQVAVSYRNVSALKKAEESVNKTPTAEDVAQMIFARKMETVTLVTSGIVAFGILGIFGLSLLFKKDVPGTQKPALVLNIPGLTFNAP